MSYIRHPWTNLRQSDQARLSSQRSIAFGRTQSERSFSLLDRQAFRKEYSIPTVIYVQPLQPWARCSRGSMTSMRSLIGGHGIIHSVARQLWTAFSRTAGRVSLLLDAA